ncbi:MAG TPA: PEP-CTERM-box response regulator transcription factor [Nitrospirales bacterium]|nr:PEP-CTERM-box response regulator transcription factor [Nitrospirales bacterium]
MKSTPAAKPALLVVEDDSEIREQMRWALADAYEVYSAGNAREALALMKREHPALVTLDLGLPPRPNEAAEGLAVLQEMLALDPLTKVVVITGNADHAHALAAVQRGAYDFMQKPVQLDVLKVVLSRASYLHQLEHENRRLQQQKVQQGFHGIIGSSAPMQQLFETVRRVSMSDLAVLVVGESGTGKELVARAIHRESTRRDGPFIAINCGAIPENLLESELFGHERGAFTGAHMQRKGRIEMAQGGTLLLDEIGELPLALQVKLLRFLQEQRIERVGGRESIAVDARVVAATNVNLAEAIEFARFRKDLYYRLSVVQIRVPPLRDRQEDLLFLAQAFLLRYRAELNAKVNGLSDEAREAIQAYEWPGNVRELENRIKRAVVMAQGPLLQPADMELASAATQTNTVTLRQARSELEKTLIRQALSRTNGNVTRAAEELGISRQALHECIHKYGLEKKALLGQ